ncbi:unnamed protein product [Closterium sp. NIES-54]
MSDISPSPALRAVPPGPSCPASALLRDICHGEGFLQSFTLPASPQQNGIAERSINLVMDVARTSMIHAAAPHFLLPFAVWYAAHQPNLWPRVSLPETSPTLRWTGKVGDASVFWVWGSRAFVRDTSADKLSAHAIPCVFLEFPHDAPGWQFYHPTLHRVLPYQDVKFDKSVPFYSLFPYRFIPLPPPLAALPCSRSPFDSGAARGAASKGAETEGAEPGDAEPGGAEPEGAGPGGAEPGGAESGGAEPGGAKLGGVEPESAESRGAEPRGTASFGGPAGVLPRVSPRPEPLSPQQLREWFTLRTHLRRGAAGVGGSTAGDTGVGGPGGTGVSARARCLGGAGTTGPGGARTGGTGAAGAGGAGGAGSGGAGAGGARAAGAGGAAGVGAGGVGARAAGDTGAAGAGGASSIGARDTGAGGAGAGGAGAVGAGS